MRRTLCALVAAATLTFSCAADNPLKHQWENSSVVRRVEVLDGIRLEGYGTAFVIHQGLRTYYVTNRHVVNNPGPESSLAIVDGPFDDYEEDDLELKIVGIDLKNDLAILRYDGQLEKRFPKPKRAAPRLGETVYTIGHPYGRVKLLDIGIIAGEKERITWEESAFGKGWFITNDVCPGASGSPAYVVRDGKPHLVGVIAGGLRDRNYGFIVAIEEADKLLKKVLKSGG